MRWLLRWRRLLLMPQRQRSAFFTPITTITNGAPGLLPGNPFTLSWFFDTALAAPGDYVNTGTSSLLRGSVPAVGSASFFTPGLGNLGCGGLPCTGFAQDMATTGSTSQGASCSTLSNPAIPGDITASFVLEGIGIGTGAFFSEPAAGGTDEAAFRIDSAASRGPAWRR